MGEIRLVPQGKQVFSIALQEMITFNRDVIVEFEEKSPCFADLQHLIFNIPGYIPTLLKRKSGEIIIDIKETLPYTVPPAQIFDIKYTG